MSERERLRESPTAIDIVFEPDNDVPGRRVLDFVEVEHNGKSVRLGEWFERPGHRVLRFDLFSLLRAIDYTATIEFARKDVPGPEPDPYAPGWSTTPPDAEPVPGHAYMRTGIGNAASPGEHAEYANAIPVRMLEAGDLVRWDGCDQRVRRIERSHEPFPKKELFMIVFGSGASSIFGVDDALFLVEADNRSTLVELTDEELRQGYRRHE